MAFACCASCGNVVSRPHGLAEFERPVGGCPECGRAMYWTATPFMQMLVGNPAATHETDQPVAAQRLSA